MWFGDYGYSIFGCGFVVVFVDDVMVCCFLCMGFWDLGWFFLVFRV